MDTPITLSSTDSIQRSSKVINSNSSTYIERVPVSWDKSLKRCNRGDANCTPCALQKVNDWIDSLHKQFKSSDDSGDRQDSDFKEKDMHENGFDLNPEALSNMYNNCNYNSYEEGITKDELNKFVITETESENPRLPYSTEFSDEVFNLRSSNACSEAKEVDGGNYLQNYDYLNKIGKFEDYESDVPLSPESEKKKELCSYLQLMKPTDKKAVTTFQNRRSVRVKNLSLMQERRELEKKIREGYPKHSNNSVSSQYPGLKSLDEMDVNLDKEKHKWLNYNYTHNSVADSFYFPKPSKYLTSFISDFDHVEIDWFDLEKQQNNKTTGFNNNQETELIFSVPKPSEQLLFSISDFDNVMKKNIEVIKNIILPKSIENLDDENCIRNGATIRREQYEKSYSNKYKSEKKVCKNAMKVQLKSRKLKNRSAPVIVSRRVTRSRPQLISEIIHSLRSRNIRKSSNLLSKKKLNKLKNVHQKRIVNTSVEHSHCVDAPIITSGKKMNSYNIHLGLNEELRSNNLCTLIPDADFSSLSNEHQKSLLFNNVNSTNSLHRLPLVTLFNSNFKSNELQTERNFYTSKIEKFPLYFKETMCENKKSDNENQESVSQCNESRFPLVISDDDCDGHSSSSINKECRQSAEEKIDYPPDNFQVNALNIPSPEFKKYAGTTFLHRFLNVTKRKSLSNSLEDQHSPSSWSSENLNHKLMKNRHSINISNENGNILKAFYLEYNLIVCQEMMVSFWTQTALGNVLGAQNMWIHKGSIQRLMMNNNCIFKESLEMVVSTEHNVSYVELWTKEHQSDIRERPVADIFAIVYFWKKGQNGLDKKVLQLENINGYADDVQYSVLKSSSKIIVSWYLATSELENKRTHVHCYQLAADYQTVHNISKFQSIEHFVSSLHSIEDCEILIAGCGENKITLWNIEYGYVVATIEMSDVKSPLYTLWFKCDRGFLFTLQQCIDRELRLIAIHGMNHSWKKLASYIPSEEYIKLKGVCVENGVILAFYDEGVICWNAQTSETIIEESQNDAEYISGNYVITIVNGFVTVRHAFTHLLCSEDL